MTEDNFPGEWWKVGEAYFQIVTTWKEEKPSYWPRKNANMRLQFYVADRDIYYSTFIDFKKYVKEECTEGRSEVEYYYYSNEVLNELWVGPNMVKKENWIAQKHFCPELSMLLHEEDSTDSDGNATSATIFASTAAALLALTAVCAMQQRNKRVSAEDHFWRV